MVHTEPSLLVTTPIHRDRVVDSLLSGRPSEAGLFVALVCQFFSKLTHTYGAKAEPMLHRNSGRELLSGTCRLILWSKRVGECFVQSETFPPVILFIFYSLLLLTLWWVRNLFFFFSLFLFNLYWFAVHSIVTRRTVICTRGNRASGSRWNGEGLTRPRLSYSHAPGLRDAC